MFSSLPSPLLPLTLFSHLISSETLGQDPVVDITGNGGKGAVDHFRGAPLRDALRNRFRVGTVGEGEELPVHSSTNLTDTNKLFE